MKALPDQAVGEPISSPDADLLSHDIPMQVQLYRQLRDEIVDGLWVDRDDFPGEVDLAERFGVSVVTSRGALGRLAEEGLVQRGRGRRPRAVHVPEVGPAQAPPMFPPVEGPEGFSYTVLRSGLATAPAAACAAFGVPAGTRLWQAERLASVGGEPHSIFQNVQRPEVGVRHDPRDLATKPMVSILRSEQRPVHQVRRTIQTATAGAMATRHLGLRLDAPVLQILMRAEGDDGELLEWTRLTVRPDRPLREESLNLQTGVWSTSG